MHVNDLESTIVTLLRLAVTDLPQDVKHRLQQALETETDSTARSQLEAILENIRLAKEHKIPMCQDTGIQIFYVTVGHKFQFLGKLPEIFRSAVIRATKEIPLRPNTVDPIAHKNPGNNIGSHIPWINWKITEGSDLAITAFPKGGGSENVCQLAMLNPSRGMKGMKQFVIESIIKAGAKPCPPIIIGVGIGGGADICLKLAKESLLRPVGERNRNQEIAEMEEQLLKAVNELGIGPMGLGGKTTALDVHIEVAMRHPASFPVGLAIQCWAARRASATITNRGEVIITSHRV